MKREKIAFEQLSTEEGLIENATRCMLFFMTAPMKKMYAVAGKLRNVFMIIGGLFILLFGVSNGLHFGNSDISHDGDLGGIAHADAVSSSDSSGAGGGADSGGGGSGDSGGGSGDSGGSSSGCGG